MLYSVRYFVRQPKNKYFVQIQRNREGKVSFKDYNVPYKSESLEGLSTAIIAKTGNFQKQMFRVIYWNSRH